MEDVRPYTNPAKISQPHVMKRWPGKKSIILRKRYRADSSYGPIYRKLHENIDKMNLNLNSIQRALENSK